MLSLVSTRRRTVGVQICAAFCETGTLAERTGEGLSGSMQGRETREHLPLKATITRTALGVLG